jgi:hypothetical protein
MEEPAWMSKRGITWSDMVKIVFSLGFLSAFVIIMIIGAAGALLS